MLLLFVGAFIGSVFRSHLDSGDTSVAATKCCVVAFWRFCIAMIPTLKRVAGFATVLRKGLFQGALH